MNLKTNEKIINSLMSNDPVLGRLIQRFGHIESNEPADPFSMLVSSIIGQQLSNKVADVLCGRLLAMLGGRVTPDKIINVSDDSISMLGISRPKVRYIKSLAEETLSGRLDFVSMQNCNDEEVITALTKVKGIGRWTAEMFLIFGLAREDVFSSGDAGLRRAIVNLYGVDDMSVAARWAPYRSYASLYLWRSLDEKPA